jgi:hypothetical protein
MHTHAVTCSHPRHIFLRPEDEAHPDRPYRGASWVGRRRRSGAESPLAETVPLEGALAAQV